jgi:cell division protein FtsB
MRFQYDIVDAWYPARNKLTVMGRCSMRISTLSPIALVAPVVLAPCILGFGTLTSGDARAQDVPGIEICTVEKTMERRTSCLQSNVDFLQKTIAKLGLDQQQKLDAANRQIEGLTRAVAGLQKTVDDLQAAQKKAIDDQKKKAEAAPARDNAAKDAKDAK